MGCPYHNHIEANDEPDRDRTCDPLITCHFDFRRPSQLRIWDCGLRIEKPNVFTIRNPNSVIRNGSGFVVWTIPSPCPLKGI